MVIGAILACLMIMAIGVAAVVASHRPIRMATVPPVELSSTAPALAHLPLPKEMRGVYVTASTASSFKNYVALLDSVKAKGINTIVLDLKVAGGALAFKPDSAALKQEAPVKAAIGDQKIDIAMTHDCKDDQRPFIQLIAKEAREL